MLRPALDDTIVAISSGWRAAPLGIVRVSGPDAFRLLSQLGIVVPESAAAARRATAFDASIALDGMRIPARILTFHAPASFTGQNVAELHIPGSLPLLRRLADYLVENGARPSLPGEFSARAYLNGKLSSAQADGVLGLIHAADGVAARQAARLARSSSRRDFEQLREELLELLARLEAGIDFVDEEDVRFITADELRSRIDGMLAQLGPLESFGRRERPHVVLAGLPNAGKSSLFNALVGRQRTIVSPIAGTTRDVISAEIEVGGCAIVLQDSAGIMAAAADLDRAANCAADAAIETADVVLWVHDASMPWTDVERGLLSAVSADRVVHVASKADLAPSALDDPQAVSTSARAGRGLDALRAQVAARARSVATAPLDSRLPLLAGGLARARALLEAGGVDISSPELIAIEIRTSLDSLAQASDPTIDDAILGSIFSKFCIGK